MKKAFLLIAVVALLAALGDSSRTRYGSGNSPSGIDTPVPRQNSIHHGITRV